MPIQRIFLLVCFALLLTGCKEKLTYAYLMEHPLVLKQEMDNCQSGGEKSNARAAHCEMVLYAAANVQSLINDMQQDPEKFGQRILDEEIASAKIKATLHESQRSLDGLKGQNAPATEVQAAQDNLKKAEKAYQDQREKVKVLLAVVGIGSPE